MSQGGISAWRMVPLFQGIGFASATIVFLLNCEYNIILSWALYYLFASFNSVLPWSHGANEWNSENCIQAFKAKEMNISSSLINSTVAYVNYLADDVNSNMTVESDRCDPVTEFWELCTSQPPAHTSSCLYY